MGLLDTIMVGHLGANAIAAVGMASMVTWAAMSVGIAFRTGTQTVVSRRLGHPVMQLEIDSGSMYAMFEEAVSEYSTQVNHYNTLPA